MPTPVEHYETAERILTEAESVADPVEAGLAIAAAHAHAQLAAVAWGGDDRDLEEVARGLDGEQVATLVDVAATLVEWIDAGGVTSWPAGTASAEAYIAGATHACRAVADLVRIARPILEGLDR